MAAATTPIRAITVCVNYDDILAISMPSLLTQVAELTVVTAPQDTRTIDYITGFSQVRPFITDAFYRHGAKFNKGLALEEGFDFMGRHGWILIIDADIVLPLEMTDYFRRRPLRAGRLYTPPRRILEDPRRWHEFSQSATWHTLPERKDRGHYGYFQLFHAGDPLLRKKPWYGVNWTHAGRCDDEFQHRWPADLKERPGFEVLHLGKCDENWFGRATQRVDGVPDAPEAAERRTLQAALRKKHGWGYKKQNVKLEERIDPAS